MALTLFALRLLATRLRGARVLCFGYPDLLCTPHEVYEATGVLVHKTTTFGSGHKIKKGLAETEETFKALGVSSMLCIDIKPSRGVEQVVDLNEYLQGNQESWDVVIDAGTIEHCANVGQALMNAANSVAHGGYVFHSPPLSMVNHGFYNISPTLLHDFYTQNGWTVVHHSGFMKSTFEGFEIEPTARFKAPSEAALYFLAQRLECNPLHWPMQSKYG